MHFFLPFSPCLRSSVLHFLRLASHNAASPSLFPSDPYASALVRLQADHVNRTLIPSFYRFLQAQDRNAQIEGGKVFLSAIEQLISLFERAEKECVYTLADGDAPVGLWREGGRLSWSDVMAAPCKFTIHFFPSRLLCEHCESRRAGDTCYV